MQSFVSGILARKNSSAPYTGNQNVANQVKSQKIYYFEWPHVLLQNSSIPVTFCPLYGNVEQNHARLEILGLYGSLLKKKTVRPT